MPEKRSGGIVLRMTWKVYAGPKGMCSSGINGGELRGQLANPGSEKKWPLKWSVRGRVTGNITSL